MPAELVIRARNGDREAFAALATAAYDQLFRIARLILRNEDAAADAVQEALTSAWIHIRAVREPDKFEAWLRRLVVHASYREARRSGRRRVVELRVAISDARASDTQDATANRDQLDDAFRRISPKHRAALVVHHYLELNDAEAASVLGVPLGTFKSRLNRASAAIRAAIEADERADRAGEGVPA
jgi:RNA polymerase sigma-70 factor, ECF subfamily